MEISVDITHVENNVCSNVIYRTVSAIPVSIPPVRHALVTTVKSKYLNCRRSNVRIGGIRDNNVTFYMGKLCPLRPKELKYHKGLKTKTKMFTRPFGKIC